MSIRDIMPFNWKRETEVPVRKTGDTTPATRDPFEAFHREFEEMFETFRREFEGMEPWQGGTVGAWAPKVNLRESETELMVEAELPGMEAKDLDVRLEKGLLVLSGERRNEKKEEKEGWQRYETSYGRFERAVALPEYVKTEEPKATLKNGVLTVTFGKDLEKARTQKVDVKSA